MRRAALCALGLACLTAISDGANALAPDQVVYNYFDFGPLYGQGSKTAGVSGTCYRTAPNGLFSCWIAAFHKSDDRVWADSPVHSNMKMTGQGTLSEVWSGIDGACGHTTDVLQTSGSFDKAKMSCTRMVSTYFPRQDQDPVLCTDYYKQVRTTIRESIWCGAR